MSEPVTLRIIWTDPDGEEHDEENVPATAERIPANEQDREPSQCTPEDGAGWAIKEITI